MAEESVQPPALPGLLRLPPHLRNRIYVHLGIGPFPEKRLIFHLGPRRSKPLHRYNGVTHHLPIPRLPDFIGLFQTCRTVHDESVALFYSSHTFVVWYEEPGSLAPLRNLTRVARAALARVKVVLCQASFHEGVGPFERPRQCCFRGLWGEAEDLECDGSSRHADPHGQPVLSLPADSEDAEACEARAHTLLTEWDETARCLAADVKPGRLELSLVCDIDSRHMRALEAAHRAVAPLAAFPVLRDCHVRLSRDSDQRL
ncbi:hypothetical protein VTJ49DRAFT_6966 [Mycothermus thermophilus]|uniref:Uncharacterized protein n=1 Tax=Humicola insolens TaxID=85995 RepID=A0ABR3VII5_HUMIN